MYKVEIIADSINPDGDRLTTFVLTYPRIIHAEVMTHRKFSKNSASCLSGDTKITIELPNQLKKGLHGASNRMTIKEIVTKWFDGDSKGRDMKARLKQMKLRSVNEQTGEFITTTIKNCFKQGVQKIYEITLKNGYTLKCTDKHRIFSEKGWITLQDLNLTVSTNNIISWNKDSPKIATNGFSITPKWLMEQKALGFSIKEISEQYNLNPKSVSRFANSNGIFFKKKIHLNENLSYKDKEWLQKKVNEGLFFTEIATMCNTSVDKVKYIARKLNIKGNKYHWTIRKAPWNKNKTYKQKEESLINVREVAKRRIKLNSYKNYKDFNQALTRFLYENKTEALKKAEYKCAISGSTRNLELHHIVPVWYDKSKAFDKNNLLPLNKKVHRLLHNRNLELDFMNYYLEGKECSKFYELYENVTKTCKEINKPLKKGSHLVVRYSDIKSIKYVGEEETYDIEVEGPYHNFIANGVVVHNSRAIPFKKMVKFVEENPFIPIAWQEDHKGMQGTLYLDEHNSNVSKEHWLKARDHAVTQAEYLNGTFDKEVLVTKQLCNRLLEPFMWHTVILSGTEFENFFKLRCPKYRFSEQYFRSWKDVVDYQYSILKGSRDAVEAVENTSIVERLKLNEGAAEIHLSYLAELMWDAYNSHTPKQLKWGEAHIPFGDNIDENKLMLECWEDGKQIEYQTTQNDIEGMKHKIAVARCARVSYQTLGDNPTIDYSKDFQLFNTLLSSKHFSPFEHVAFANIKGSGNFDGWKQYRYYVER